MRAWDNTQTRESHAQCVRLGRSVNLIEISVLVTYVLFSTYRKYAILFYTEVCGYRRLARCAIELLQGNPVKIQTEEIIDDCLLCISEPTLIHLHVLDFAGYLKAFHDGHKDCVQVFKCIYSLCSEDFDSGDQHALQ